MKTAKLVLASGLFLALVLTGCGGPAKKAEEPKKAEPVQTKPGLGISQAELLKGIDEIKLGRVEQGGPPTFLGYTPDREQGGTTYTSIVVQGSPETVMYAKIVAGCDSSKGADLVARNMRYVDAFLSNVFGGNVPDEIKKELAFVKENQDKKRQVVAGNRNITLFQELTKQLEIDVR